MELNVKSVIIKKEMFMSHKPKIWKGLEELNNSSEFEENKHNEFPEKLPLGELSKDVETLKSPRRDFLKFMGFSLTATPMSELESDNSFNISKGHRYYYYFDQGLDAEAYTFTFTAEDEEGNNAIRKTSVSIV